MPPRIIRPAIPAQQRSDKFRGGSNSDREVYHSELDEIVIEIIRENIPPIEPIKWGDIIGNLTDQTDLQIALDDKYDNSNPVGYIDSSALVPLSNDIITLKNNELKILYFQTVNSTSGTITIPTNATIILNDFPQGLDAIAESYINGEPSGLSPRTAGNIPVTVSGFDVSGNYILSGTPTSFPIAILFILKIKAKDFSSLNFDNIIESQIVDAASISYVDNGLSLKEASITSSGNIIDYWSGIKTFRNLASDVRAILLTGLSLVTSIPITSLDSILIALGKLQAQITTLAQGIIFVGRTGVAYTQGLLYYDSTNECLTFFNNDSNISLQIGQEEWIRVINNTGSTIINGSAIYLSGATSLPTIALAKADQASTIIGAGLVTESIINGAIGYVTCMGIVNGLDTSGFTAGQTIFISSTIAGGLTNIAPTSPNYRYRIGIVGMVSSTVGTIHVTPSTAALGNGTSHQVFGMNKNGTAQEIKNVPIVLISSATSTSGVTGTVNNTLDGSYLIPGGTVVPGRSVLINFRSTKVGTAGTDQIRININTTNSISGATQLGIYSAGATNISTGIERKLIVKSSTLTEVMPSTIVSTLETNSFTSAVSSVNIDWTVDQYVITSQQNSNTGDRSITSGMIIMMV